MAVCDAVFILNCIAPSGMRLTFERRDVVLGDRLVSAGRSIGGKEGGEVVSFTRFVVGIERLPANTSRARQSEISAYGRRSVLDMRSPRIYHTFLGNKEPLQYQRAKVDV